MKLTYAEITDTFNALGQTAAYIDDMWGDIKSFVKDKKRFVFVGCGSSYLLSKSMAVMTGMHTGISAFAVAAGDILLHAERYAKYIDGAAVVCVSRSGRTSEMIMALDALTSKGYSFTVTSLVCADSTSLADKSELTLSMPWAFDNSVCQTRTVTNFYFAAAYILAKATDNQTVLEDLRHITSNGSQYLQEAEVLADEFSTLPWTHCVVLADAEPEGLAEEGALAFKEICQLPSNYYHLLDVRHGPMVLIKEDTLVLAALGAKNELECNLLRDIKKKNAQLIAFSDTDCTPVENVRFSVYGRPLSHIARGIPFAILCQMISYKKSLSTGADPDKPDGLDPWIAL
ncbi:MAG: SIS domain-containing protein [Oscillospiraceae bacterium]|nr:SIS domain-containing protein [Oscillospiraceae bacterium]